MWRQSSDIRWVSYERRVGWRVFMKGKVSRVSILGWGAGGYLRILGGSRIKEGLGGWFS